MGNKKTIIISILVAALLVIPLIYALPPTLIFITDKTHTTNTVAINASATDIPNGIEWVKIYENGTEIYSRPCAGSPVCIISNHEISKVETGNFAYHSQSMNKKGEIATSQTIVVTFAGMDDDYPQYSNINATPDPSFYNPANQHMFNVTWTDPGEITEAIIEHNFNGALQNDTVTIPAVGNVYSYLYPQALLVGTYQWKMYATDDAIYGKHTNSTPMQTYIVQPGDPILNITMLPGATIIYTNQSNVSCTAFSNETIPTLTMDGNPVSNPHIANLSGGEHTYVCDIAASANYNASQITGILNVTRLPSAVNLTLNGVNADYTAAVARGTENITINGTLLTGEVDYIELYANNSLIASGTSPQLLNHSFAVTGTYNITVVYPQSDNYSRSSITYLVTNVTDLTAPGSVINLTNTSNTEITIDIEWINPSDDDFNQAMIYLNGTNIHNTSNETYTITGLNPNNDYNITLHTIDFNNNINNADVTIITTTLPDTGYPQYTNMITSPLTPVTYSPGAFYQFNTTWTDNFGISLVQIEHNFTGTLTNDTMSNISSEYYYNFTDLAAGNYIWSSNAQDVAGLINSTTQWAFVINPATPNSTLIINPSTGLDDYTPINVSCSSTNDEITPTLYRNGSLIPNNIITTYPAGDSLFVCNASASQNYTASSDSVVISLALAPRITGDIQINEFMADPSTGNDWVEIYNNDSVTVDLTGWQLNDTGSATAAATLSGLLNPGEFLQVFVGVRLNNGGGESIELLNTTNDVIDTYAIGAGVPQTDVSIGRYPEGTNNWYDQEYPTPGAANIGPDSIIPVINSISDAPDPLDQGQNITITANVTDNIGVGTAWVGISGTNYTMTFVSGDIYTLIFNTSILSPGLNSYTVYADDIYATKAVPQSGDFTVNDVKGPIMPSFSASPNPVERGSDILISVNVTDETTVGEVLTEIEGTNYTMIYTTGDLWTYNYSTGSSPVGGVTYAITAKDIHNNPAILNPIGIFTVQDTTGPTITGTTPANGGSLAAGTTSTTITVITNEISICRYNTSDEVWANMTEMPTTNAITHQLPISGLSNGNTYNYYFLCEDSIGNPIASSYHLQFNVASSAAPTGGGGGGSTRRAYEIELTIPGVAIELARNDKAVYDFKNIQYETLVEYAGSTTATIKTNGISTVFKIGNELLYDLNKDGDNDLSVTLIKLNNAKATILFKLIEEAFIPTVVTTEPDEKETEDGPVIIKKQLPAGVFREEVPEKGIGAASLFLSKAKNVLRSPYTKYAIAGIIVLAAAIIVLSIYSDKIFKVVAGKKKKNNSNGKNNKKK